MSKRWFCAECHRVCRRSSWCECGGRPVSLSAPGRRPAFVAHLAVLDDVPPPAAMLDTVFEGHLRYPFEDRMSAHTVCKQDGAQSVWLWQANLEPLLGLDDGDEEDVTSAIDTSEASRGLPSESDWQPQRAFSETNLMLLEPFGSDRHFQARYYRRRHREPPSLSEIIDGLRKILPSYGARIRAVALLDPQERAMPQERARLETIGNLSEAFDNREDALRWLIRVATGSQRRLEKLPLLRDQVGVFDIGGGLGREFLAWLHCQTLLAGEAASEKEWVKLPRAGLVRGRRLWGSLGLESRECGRIHRLRSAIPAPADTLPPWSGQLRLWRRTWPFEVRLTSGLPRAASNQLGSALVVGVGPLQRAGEKDLAVLVENRWQGRWVPTSFLIDDSTDPTLLRWVRGSFPEATMHQASDTGRWRALHDVLGRLGGEAA